VEPTQKISHHKIIFPRQLNSEYAKKLATKFYKNKLIGNPEYAITIREEEKGEWGDCNCEVSGCTTDVAWASWDPKLAAATSEPEEAKEEKKEGEKGEKNDVTSKNDVPKLAAVIVEV
jgi:hypothetical protein